MTFTVRIVMRHVRRPKVILFCQSLGFVKHQSSISNIIYGHRHSQELSGQANELHLYSKLLVPHLW